MVRRLVVGLLVVAGLLLVALGVQRWLDSRAAENTVHAFMAAVRAADRAAALKLFTSERRRQIELRQADEERPAVWKVERGVSYGILELAIAGDAAIARLKLHKQGFSLEPTIHLRRGETSSWKIDAVENVEIDPRFRELQRAYGRQQGEQFADKLREALKDQPGVGVERVNIPDLPAEPQ